MSSCGRRAHKSLSAECVHCSGGILPPPPYEAPVINAQGDDEGVGAQRRSAASSVRVGNAFAWDPPRPTDASGLCTAARATRDGLVDIQIGFAAEKASARSRSTRQDEDIAPTFASLHGEDDDQAPQTTPPQLNIVMQVVGSTDVMPFVSIAKELQSDGHRVRIATHPRFRFDVEDNGIEFFNIGADPAKVMAFMTRNPGFLPSYQPALNRDVSRQRQLVRGIMERCWLACIQPSPPDTFHTTGTKHLWTEPPPFIADAIIANPPAFAHLHCAERLGIPLHLFSPTPWSPTRSFPHPLATIKANTTDRPMNNLVSYSLVEAFMWQGVRTAINTFRTEILGLEALDSLRATEMLSQLRIPFTYCWSPSLLHKPSDWDRHISVSGYCPPPLSATYVPTVELRDFLEDGPPPVYIGFGSVVVDDAPALIDIILDAIELARVRAVVSREWTAVGTRFEVSRHILYIEDCPHEWLFPRVSCVIHHGSAGTTAASLRAGKPTVIVPFFGDQFFWRNTVVSAGAGPMCTGFRDLTAEKLATAIKEAMQPIYTERASEIGQRMSVETGLRNAVHHFYQSLPSGLMTCSLDRNRCARWQHRRLKDLRLSAFAATVLHKERVVDMKHLKPLRVCEYRHEIGPIEPLSGATLAVSSFLYSAFKGIGEVATEAESVALAIGRVGAKDKSPQKVYSVEIDAASEPSEDSEAAPPRPRVGERLFRGSTRFLTETLRLPMTVTLALAQGAHNLPKTWGDKRVRKTDEITGLRSGMLVGAKNFTLSTYDGISDLIVQPYIGVRDGGILGGFAGFGKGLMSSPMKFLEAASAPVAYPLKGLDVEIQKAIRSTLRDPVVTAIIACGEQEYSVASEREKLAILEAWHGLDK